MTFGSLPGAERPSPPPVSDVVVIGGGLSGTLAAIVLGRAGHSVTLVERNNVPPPEFRVEKIGGHQLSMIKRLGLMDALSESTTHFKEILNVRRGRVLDRTKGEHFGFSYNDLVSAMRRMLPDTVRFVVGRVDAISTSPDRQTVSILHQETLSARLIVLATGMGDLLRRSVGIERHVIHERQSLTFGFNLRPTGSGSFKHPAVTYYGEHVSDGIDYLSLFPVEGGTRANLFTFRDHRDPWVKALRQNPKETLVTTLPGLTKELGDFDVVGPVQTWIMDIAVSKACKQDGIVLIGDAYQTSCPAAGTGVARLLTDVERLCTVHIPAWLKTAGMPASKIAEFYDDPEKQAADALSLKLARYRRSLTLDTNLRWRAHRVLLRARRRLLHQMDRFAPSLVTTLRMLRGLTAG